MARISPVKLQQTVTALRKIIVFTIAQLVTFLNCSIPTARLKLKQWNTFTSYNKNGRYYTMPGTPKFDENGLWFYDDICFSKHGNLKQTVLHLIKKSDKGLSGTQLGEIIHLSPRSFLQHFKKLPGIRREKHDGVYVYFCDDEKVYQKQIEKRTSIPALTRKVPSDTEAIRFLIEFIKHPKVSVEKLAEILAKTGIKIEPAIIYNFLESHDILKKTPDTPR